MKYLRSTSRCSNWKVYHSATVPEMASWIKNQWSFI